MEKIKNAISKNELSKFLLGEDEYKVEGRADNAEPNDYLFCWESEIIPILNTAKNDIELEDSLLNILKFNDDHVLAIYTVMSHLFWYYYFKNKGDIQLELDLQKIEKLLFDLININKSKLLEDKRWAGADWNSNNGLWGPIQNLAITIKEKYNGINLIVS